MRKKNRKNDKRIRIAYFIDSINDIAGTEKQLVFLINNLDRKKIVPYLFCLRKPSAVFNRNKLKADYYEIGMENLISMRSFIKLILIAAELRRLRIDIIQTFFIDANIVGVLCGILSRTKLIIGSRRDLGFWHTKKLLFIALFV